MMDLVTVAISIVVLLALAVFLMIVTFVANSLAILVRAWRAKGGR